MEFVALGGLAVGALGLLVTLLTTKWNIDSTERLAHNRTQREDHQRRVALAETTGRKVMARLDEMRRRFAYRRGAEKPTQALLEPFRDEILIAAEDFDSPARDRLIRLADLLYYWDDDKAYEAKTPWSLVLSDVADAGRAIVGAYLRGEPPSSLERIDRLFTIHETVDAEWRANMDAAMEEERLRRVEHSSGAQADGAASASPVPAVSLASRRPDSLLQSPTQRVTAVDLAAGRIRLPAKSRSDAKGIFPSAPSDVSIVLRERAMTVKYDPRFGPDRERSGVLSIGRETLAGLVAVDEVLAVTGGSDGRPHLD
jgi:hypothetical protein